VAGLDGGGDDPMGLGGTPARVVLDEDGLSWSAGGRRLVRDILDRREGIDGVRKLIDFEEHQADDTYGGGRLETNVVEHVPTQISQPKRKLSYFLSNQAPLVSDVPFPTNETEIQEYVKNRLNFNVDKWKRSDLGVTHHAFGTNEADGTPRTQFSTRSGNYVKPTNQHSVPWEGSFVPTIRGAASSAGSTEFFKRIRAFQRAKDFASIPPYLSPKESSRFGATLSKDAQDMWHTDSWFQFLSIRKQVLDDIKKTLHRKRTHPYKDGFFVVPETGFRWGPRNGTRGGGFTEVLEEEDASSLRRSLGEIIYLDGSLVDDGSFTGSLDLFFSPNVDSVTGEVYPDFESDVTDYPYDALVHQYLCGTQYLYDDNTYDSTTGRLVVDETKQYVFRNMYYDDEYTFLDHPEKDFKRVFPTSDFDHLYDYPASKFKPTQGMFDRIYDFEDLTDSAHESEMEAISKTCDADAIAAESTHWDYCPAEFMYVRKSLIGPSKLVHYARDQLYYNTLAKSYDVGSITKDSDPSSGLPWLNKAKEDYVYVKSLIHVYHAGRDNLACDQSISICEDSFEETIRVMNAASLLQVVGDGVSMIDQQITRLEFLKDRFEKAKLLLFTDQKWAMLFPIQQMEINLKIMNNSKKLFEGVDAISDMIERATALGNLATVAVQGLVGTTAAVLGAQLIDEIVQSQPSDSDTGVGGNDASGPPGPDDTGGTEGTEGSAPDGAGANDSDSDTGGSGHVCDPNAIIWDALCHTAYEILSDPGTIGTAMTIGQYQTYVNSGGTVHPGSDGDTLYYHYAVTLWTYQYEQTGVYKTADELGMRTYRIYLEGRTGYSIGLHGHYHRIDISEMMPESVFDLYLSNGRIMPAGSVYILPFLYTTPDTYKEYLEGLLNYDEVTHRYLWGWFDPLDVNHESYDPFNDPDSIEMKPNNFVTPEGYSNYAEYIQSRSNYSTSLADMYSADEFYSLGMGVDGHPYEIYIRNREDYLSTVADMMTRAEYMAVVPFLHTGTSYEIYRVDRTDYDSMYHSWDSNDNPVPTWWQTAELVARTKSDFEPSQDALRASSLPSWRLVRYLPPGGSVWYTTRDNLAGTDAAFGNKGDVTAAFNLIFDGPDDEEPFTEYLLASSNFGTWMWLDKSELETFGVLTGATAATMKRTHANPFASSTATWLNRTNVAIHPSDPWLSVGGHGLSMDTLYSEHTKSWPVGHNLSPEHGSQIFVR